MNEPMTKEQITALRALAAIKRPKRDGMMLTMLLDEIDRLTADNKRLMAAVGATGTQECPTCDGTGQWTSGKCIRCNGSGMLILIPGSYDPPALRPGYPNDD